MRCVHLLQPLESVGIRSEFPSVTDLELLPFGQVLAKPLTQLRARAQFLEPQIDRRALLRETARPKPADQNPQTVVGGRPFIYALESKHSVHASFLETYSRSQIPLPANQHSFPGFLRSRVLTCCG